MSRARKSESFTRNVRAKTEHEPEDELAGSQTPSDTQEDGDYHGDGGAHAGPTNTQVVDVVRYVLGVHSQGKPIMRAKLYKLLVDTGSFQANESSKASKMAGILQGAEPILSKAFGYRLAKYDRKKSGGDPYRLTYKEETLVLERIVPEAYAVANAEGAHSSVSDETYMAYVCAALMTLVVGLGNCDYSVLSNALIAMGLEECLYKGEKRNVHHMIGLLAYNGYVNLFENGDGYLVNPMTHRELAKNSKQPCQIIKVLSTCEAIGRGQHEARKPEVVLGPRMYYDFSANAVFNIFKTVRGSEQLEFTGLNDKITASLFVRLSDEPNGEANGETNGEHGHHETNGNGYDDTNGEIYEEEE